MYCIVRNPALRLQWIFNKAIYLSIIHITFPELIDLSKSIIEIFIFPSRFFTTSFLKMDIDTTSAGSCSFPRSSWDTGSNCDMASVPFESTAMASLEGREMWLSLSFSALSNPRFKKALYHEACGPCNCKVPVDSYQLRMRWSALIEFLFSFSNSIAVFTIVIEMFFGEINKYFERTRPRKLSFGDFQMSDVGQIRKCKRIIIIVVLFTKIRGAKSNTSRQH